MIKGVVKLMKKFTTKIIATALVMVSLFATNVSAHDHGSSVNAKGYAASKSSTSASQKCTGISDATNIVNSVMDGCLVNNGSNRYKAAVFSPTGQDRPYRVRMGARANITVSSNTLQLGSKSVAVTTLQDALVGRGYLKANDVDGDFGKITDTAVRAFQRDKIGNYGSDGIVGPMTWGRLFLMS